MTIVNCEYKVCRFNRNGVCSKDQIEIGGLNMYAYDSDHECLTMDYFKNKQADA